MLCVLESVFCEFDDVISINLIIEQMADTLDVGAV